MLRLAAATAAVALFAVSFVTAPVQAVFVAGAIGLLLSGLGIATLWRWTATASACVFVADYALALWIATSPVRMAGAVCVGLALLLLLQSLELARCARHATIDAGFVRSQSLGWVAFAPVTLGVTALTTGLAGGLAGAIPMAIAPLLAAAGALGVVLALALALTRTASRGESGGR